MQVKRLMTTEERLEGERIIATAFLNPWDEAEAHARCQAQTSADGQDPEQIWGLTDDAGRMVAAVSTLRHHLFFGGTPVPVGEVHMVGSLPEARGGGNVRTLMSAVLRDFRERGDVFAVLIPFSFAFYRKFGFELSSRTLKQRVAIGQLAGIACDFDVERVTTPASQAIVRRLCAASARTRNLAELRADDAWEWSGDGEWGQRDFLHQECQRYTYLLRDRKGEGRAYVTFIYLEGDHGPFVGELKVCDLAYDSPDALWQILGFLYHMRAKVTHVTFELCDLDLATILPECEEVERTLGGHVMARVLDVPRALELMDHPGLVGSYVVEVTDGFLDEVGGRWRVSYTSQGPALVRPTTDEADLIVSIAALTQLVVGRIGLSGARLRRDVRILSNEELLARLFVERSICLTL